MTHWSKITDKVEPHGYYPAYLRLASQIGPEGRVCEIGVAGGGSMDMWQALFPFGLVVGVDRDPSCGWPEGTKQVIALCDDPDLPERLEKISGKYDLIVDDCSHDGILTRRTFDLLWPLVEPGGYYVVEDWNGYFQGHFWGPGIMGTVQGFLELLSSREAECDSIEYRYGLAILHRQR